MNSQTDGVLLDTDVFSYLLNHSDRRADFYRPHVQNKILSVSFVTVGELYYAAVKKLWGTERVAVLEARLAAVVVKGKPRRRQGPIVLLALTISGLRLAPRIAVGLEQSQAF